MNVYSLVLLSLSLEIEYRVGKSADINLALNRTATYCDDPTPLTWLTDGDTNLSMEISKTCTEYSYVEIYLGDQYFVHYVIVYEGILGRDEPNEGLHRFMVENIDDKGISTKCGMYNIRSNIKDEIKNMNDTIINNNKKRKNVGMRVNCFAGNYSKVRVKSNTNEGFSIAEVEVYTIGIELKGGIRAILYSCSDAVPLDDSLTLINEDDCCHACWNLKYLFAAKKETECICSNNYDLPIKNVEIQTREEWDEKCGIKYFLIYIVQLQLPYYIGCFNTEDWSFESIFPGSLTPSKCIEKCASHLKSYAGVTTDECFCLTEMVETRDEDYIFCNVTCEFTKTFCGGKDHASLYGTGAENKSISKYIQCGKWNQYGICNEPCRESIYKGEYCLEYEIDFIKKDVNPNNNKEPAAVSPSINKELITSSSIASNCPVDYCMDQNHTECVETLTSFQCVCIMGYLLNENGSCEDFDECFSIPCDERSSTCLNEIGYYTCKCKSGFISTGTQFCLSNGSEVRYGFGIEINQRNILHILIPLIGMTLVLVFLCLAAPARSEEIAEEPEEEDQRRKSSVKIKQKDPSRPIVLSEANYLVSIKESYEAEYVDIDGLPTEL